MPGRLPSLGAQELALMKVVWRLGEVSVRDVYENIAARKPTQCSARDNSVLLLERLLTLT